MEQGNGFEFVVDEQYENEKGIFTVLSIHKNEMVIRWESGEEISTDIELQRNIQARRQWERLQKEKEKRAVKSGRRSGSAKAAESFKGLKKSDFKNSASGTQWRGRNQLGGAVTHNLTEGKFNINSWAFANKPEIHWLDTQHQKRKSGDCRAKFFVRLDTDSMFFGFSVGRPADDKETSKNWDTFCKWLGLQENEATVHQLALSDSLAVWNANDPQSRVLKPEKAGWQVESGGKKKKVRDISAFIEDLSSEGPVNLEIAKVIDKQEAVSSGKDIAKEVARLMDQLIPLYRAAVETV